MCIGGDGYDEITIISILPVLLDDSTSNKGDLVVF